MVIIWKNLNGKKGHILGEGENFENAIIGAAKSGGIPLYEGLSLHDTEGLMLYIEAAKSDYIVEYTEK